MKGKITLSREEIRTMVGKQLNLMLSAANCRVTTIKTDGYGSYDPGLEVEFTDEPEEKEGE